MFQALRSLIFNIFLFGWLAAWMLSAMLLVYLLLLPARAMRKVVQAWVWTSTLAMRPLIGLSHEIRGRENLPPGPVVLASKHQSAWDTGIFYLMVPDPIYVMKTELLKLPVWGWYARRANSIGVDRKAGASALKKMVRDVEDRLAKGHQVIIFPEGTRTTPGQHVPFHPGIAAVYAKTEVPVVPIALNSGVFWGRRSFTKKPGRIVVEILEPMPRGLDRKTFLAELQSRIDTASDRLAAEATGRQPPLWKTGMTGTDELTT